MAEAPRTDAEGSSRGTEEWEGDRLGRGQTAPPHQLDNSPTNQLAEIDIWMFWHTDVSFRLLDVSAPRWSFRPKPKAAFRLARKKRYTVNPF